MYPYNLKCMHTCRNILGLMHACYMHIYMHIACKHNLVIVYRTITPVFYKNAMLISCTQALIFFLMIANPVQQGLAVVKLLPGSFAWDHQIKEKVDLQKLTFS